MLIKTKNILKEFNLYKVIKLQKQRINFSRMNKLENITYLNQIDSINLDQDLFNQCGFSVDQLMELAGLSIASVIQKVYPTLKLKNNKVLIVCGPGNNGGDGLVAARHLKLFNYEPEIYYPKHGNSQLFKNLIKQVESFDIKIINNLEESNYSLIIDALFGFSFKPPVRPQFIEVLERIMNLKENGSKLISIDIPSGWDVEKGPPKDGIIIKPDCLISLTCPKICSKHFNGIHWLGGRFIPEQIKHKYNLKLPLFKNSDQCICIKE